MKDHDFTTTIIVDQTPQQVFDAINNVRDWWTGEIEGESHKVGDEFIYRYEQFHYSKHKVVELVPGKRVVWLTTDSSLNFVDSKTEWTGTKVIFDISKKEGKTQVQFTHQGLVPENECYNDCSNAWTGLIKNNLRELIATGNRKPKLHN